MLKPTRVSFGGTAAIVTSMALIAGLEAANAGKATVVGALLIAAIADNLTDSLSVHVYQESEQMEQRDAFLGTVSNFATRLVVCMTFVAIVAVSWHHSAAAWGIVWGMALLSVLSYVLARERTVNAAAEVAKHVITAVAVVIVSEAIGHWINAHVL